MRRRLRQVASSGSDAGLTLTELIVGMTITALALMIFGAFFTNVSLATRDARSSRAGTGIAANAVDEIGRVVRAGAPNPQSNSITPAVVDGTAASLTLTAYVDTDSATPRPTKVNFTVNAAGNLVETRTAAVSTDNYWQFTGTTSSRTIATTGTAGALQVAFGYNDQDGQPIVIAATGITTAQALAVQSITVTVTVANRVRSGDDPVVVSTTALMPNVKLT